MLHQIQGHRRILGVLQCASLIVLVPGCLTPPAVREAGADTISLRDFPARTQLITLAAANGEQVRGVFVPAEPGAPVVLHLLESGASITRGTEGFPAIWELRAHGFAQLCVDYRGVGASDGEVSPWNIPDDARAAWIEAVRRAGGNAQRVVLRGTSLGSLAIASLLESGAVPAAIVVAAPIREGTAVRSFAAEWGDGWERVLAPLLYRRPASTNLVEALRCATVPTLVVAGGEDYFLRTEERDMFRRALDRENGRYVERTDDGHNAVVYQMRREIEEERTLYRRLFPDIPNTRTRLEAVWSAIPDGAIRFPEGSAERARLKSMLARVYFDSPALSAACSLSWDVNKLEEQRGVQNWVRALDDGMPLDALAALVSFEDPMGRFSATDFFGWKAWATSHSVPSEPAALLHEIRRTRRHARVTVMSLVWGDPGASLSLRTIADRDTGEMPDRFLGHGFPGQARLKLPEREMLRQGFLLALKALEIPARAVWVGDRWQVEIWDRDGSQRRIELEPAG